MSNNDRAPLKCRSLGRLPLLWTIRERYGCPLPAVEVSPISMGGSTRRGTIRHYADTSKRKAGGVLPELFARTSASRLGQGWPFSPRQRRRGGSLEKWSETTLKFDPGSTNCRRNTPEGREDRGRYHSRPRPPS